ncbi:MAG: integrase core domain-containing protein [Proteobacteria bacterium]|nr:integrase core domain-containing protein [Pseudomonadota bacterium]
MFHSATLAQRYASGYAAPTDRIPSSSRSLKVWKAHIQEVGRNLIVVTGRRPGMCLSFSKRFIRIAGMTHVGTSPYYPQSNGKIERYHRTIKSDAIRVRNPGSLAEARQVVTQFVKHYNEVRLHSAIGYLTPIDKMNGLEKEIWLERDRKFEEARERRRQRRAAQSEAA